MGLETLALASALICHVPSDNNLIGLWESTAISRGGIGHNVEFRGDGSYTTAVTVIVDVAYDVKDGRFYTAKNKGEPISYDKGLKIEVSNAGFSLTGDDGKKEIREKQVAGTEQTIVGTYRYRHYSGGMAYEKYTDDGLLKFRLPMSAESGCYSTNRRKVTIKLDKGEEKELNFRVDGKLLVLEGKKGKFSYDLVPEGAWYPGKVTDYQKPTE